MGEMKNAYKILVEYSEGKSPLGRPVHRWEDNIQKGLRDRISVRYALRLMSHQLLVLFVTIVATRGIIVGPQIYILFICILRRV
jgi:hypothetical protein